MNHCRPPIGHEIFKWRRWQENKVLFFIQLSSIIAMIFTFFHPFFFQAILGHPFSGYISLIALIILIAWISNLMTKNEVYAIKDEIKFFRNNKEIGRIEISNNDTIEIKYQPAKAWHIFNCSGYITICHRNKKINPYPTFSHLLPELIANQISQYINCHPNLVMKVSNFRA